MYCVKCGVELSDGEKQCPLCGTRVYHPDIQTGEAFPPYPSTRTSTEQVNPRGVLFIVTFLFALPVMLCLMIDLRVHNALTWSGYAVGALLLLYLVAVLPSWFKKPNPVIFVPIDFVAAGLYLLYINFALSQHWFLSFAFPVVGMLCLIATAAIALFKYLPRAGLFIMTGLFFAIGGFCILLEMFITITFNIGHTFLWSVYPAAACVLLGAMFLVIALCRPLRENLHKKFFL
ncbi:MAG: zinc ribbon domain-containing protein [Oscillospiraceae bacterium]|nr:zinc ribbon domain-containing protein [Oscillospiraceae bacterium]